MVDESAAQWDAFRSQKRSAIYTPPFAPWMITALQLAKFSIFVALHSIMLFGAAISKGIIIFLATNLSKPSHNPLETKFSKECPRAVSRDDNLHAGVHIALLLVHIVPDLVSIVQCFYRLTTIGRGQGGINIPVIFLETCRTIGFLLMFFHIFPQLDMLRALLITSCLPIIPIAQKLLMDVSRTMKDEHSLMKRFGMTLATFPSFIVFLVLTAGCYLWTVLDTQFDRYIILPLAIMLASLGFWESWIGTGHAGTFFHHLHQMKYGIRKMNAPTRLLTSTIRILITLTIFVVAAGNGKVTMKGMTGVLFHWKSTEKHWPLLMVGLCLCVLHMILRISSRLLAGLELRVLSGFHPIFLTSPLLLTALVIHCHISPDCWIASKVAAVGLTFRCSQWITAPIPFNDIYLALMWLLISMYKGYQFASQPNFDKHDEIIRATPVVMNPFCIEQSLLVFEFAISRDESKLLKLDFDSIHDEHSGKRSFRSEGDRVANVYICATMWHETENEMKQMFGSILKLDEECAHLSTRKTRHLAGNANETPKFRLEAHIFFDDAWEDQPELGRAPNEYFRTFFNLLNSMIDGKENANRSDPTKVLVGTAYGGRLVVRLPAGTLLFIHLKDKKLIRHKKRWSQVMYMYYLLGHRIMESHMSIEDKQVIAENTYILAIDGDSKFEPEAFLRLLNLMHNKADIGCACGRIHPIGKGMMVWYQKFEYAIAHWFQKAAEHVFGCVLCAPGCFSLFRAAALMDDNIMHKYTTTAVEPRHFVQYDQGEDRWLSTLLLKQGYRIEYAAASDAETYAPEGFEEFFNQRRRWTPSSVANTIDLLADYQRACANNACISKIYILYQFCVIGFSMLGPAIIFSMLLYAQVAAFHVHMDRIMIYNTVPVGFFIFTCFAMESNIQLFVAKVLSIGYAFVMLAVIVATCSQIVLETMFSPTSMFVVGMIFIFLFAACLHPREFTNIIYGTIFFLMIPATYVILSFYSLINLNVINWGTREAVAKATGQETKKESKLETKLKKAWNGATGTILRKKEKADDKRIEELERQLEEVRIAVQRPNPFHDASIQENESAKKPSEDEGDSSDGELSDGSEMVVRTSQKDLWMDAEYLQVCEKGRLKPSEQQFWDQLIDTYLKPIQTSPEQNLAYAKGLKDLRNNVAFSLILLNALMVLAIYLTQNHKDVLAFSWMPHEDFKQFRWNSTAQEWTKQKVPLKVEMLGLSIIFALFGILLVQTVGLILHRLNTMVGAFQEIKAMGDFVTTAATKKEDDEQILEAARSLLDTSHYWRSHGGSGYTRDIGADREAVLHRLQRTRLATAIRNHDSSRPK